MSARARKSFGARIRQLRFDHGWTQEHISEHSGVSVRHLSELENGQRQACLDVMVKLAAAFELTLSDLLRGV